MPLDRDSTLRKAEKLLRQGRLDAAIAEYVKVVEEYPRDWTSANTLGDLYVRAGQLERAAEQYARIAEHFAQEGFLSKAAALYKKILKIRPDDEASQLRLADVAARQGLLADAKAQLAAVAERRWARGDRVGAGEILIRLGSLDPADFDARRTAARVLAEAGDLAAAAARFRELAADLAEKGREAEALDALREAVRCDPNDRESRARLARAAVAGGRLDEAQELLTREVAGDDPVLLAAYAEIALRTGQAADGLAAVREALAALPEAAPRIADVAWSLCEQDPDTAFGCVEVLADRSAERREWAEAAAVLQEFVARVPRHIPALLKLVEVCVDGGLEATMYAAQAQLADAYLDAGLAMEASVIAEDLVAREPWEAQHLDRFRRALAMMKIPNPDAVIAERLSGQSPFTATDPFVEAPATPIVPLGLIAPRAPETGPEPRAGGPRSRPGSEPARAGEPAREVAAAGSVTAEPAGCLAPELEIEASTAAPAPPREETFEPVEIDLTAALAGTEPETSAAPARGLDEVFETFRDEATREAADAQGEQYLALARTYRDMGMRDEAIRALETAVRSPRHRFEAASLLGALYKEKAQLVQAVEWLERAAEAPAPSVEAGRALLYELGVTLEGLGEVARALAVFLELQADAGEYRDVGSRIDRLSRVATGG